MASDSWHPRKAEFDALRETMLGVRAALETAICEHHDPCADAIIDAVVKMEGVVLELAEKLEGHLR